ncbi:MAG: hypothetical protein AB7F50_01425 [Fimbriimonadaceae bacterium]
MARSLFCFIIGVFTGAALIEAARWVKSEHEAHDIERLSDQLSDKFDVLEQSLPAASAQL